MKPDKTLPTHGLGPGKAGISCVNVGQYVLGRMDSELFAARRRGYSVACVVRNWCLAVTIRLPGALNLPNNSPQPRTSYARLRRHETVQIRYCAETPKIQG